MFAKVFIHEYEYWVIALHWSLPMTCFRGFTWIGPVRISLFVLVVLCSRFANYAFLSTSFIALKFKSALSLVLISQGHTPHARFASVLIVFLKRLADFRKKLKFCTIPTWTNSVFYIGIQN